MDASEVPKPGRKAPKPLPIPEEPVGGKRMGGCRFVLPKSALKVPSKISATSWIVVDLDTGDVLAAKDPHGRHRPASLIKVLLALVVMDELAPGKVVTAGWSDARQECTCIGIRRGQRYSVHNLFTGLLISSGNDAAHTLGSALGGIPKALAKMNAKAKELGALDTRAATTSGLDGPGMSSSAYDQALIFREALRHPRFAKAIATRELRFKWRSNKPAITLYNDNRLLGQAGFPAYPGFLGGKTGFTDDARHTYLGAAERSGRRIAVVLMRAEQKPLRTSVQAKRMLDYGFRLAKAGTEPVGTLVQPGNNTHPPLDDSEPVADAAAEQPEEEGSDLPLLIGGLIVLIALVGGFALRAPRR